MFLSIPFHAVTTDPHTGFPSVYHQYSKGSIAMHSRSDASMRWRMLLVALTTVLLSTCIAASSVHVALPDVAGLLIPQQTQRIVRFGNASALGDASSFLATRLDASDPPDVPVCEPSSSLCLEVVLTSAYEWDPFTLRAFESRLSHTSKTFDPVVVGAAQGLVLPVIDGDASAALVPRSGLLIGAPQTLWRFSVASVPIATIDLLFRLRQRSQLRAARDQLAVHVAVSSYANATMSTRVEAYTVYGNARTSHRVTQLNSRQLRLDLALIRNASLADVMLPDADPVMSVDAGQSRRWRVVDVACLNGLALLLNCSTPEDFNSGACSFETSKAALPALLRDSYGLTTAWYEAFAESRDVGQSMSLGAWLNASFNQVMMRSESVDFVPTEQPWWSTIRALNTLSARHCPFGPLSIVESSANKMLHLADTTPFTFQLVLTDSPTFSGVFYLKFGTDIPTLATSTVSHMNTTDEIARAVQAPMASLDLVHVAVTRTFNETTSSWLLRVVVSDLVLPTFALLFRMDNSNFSLPFEAVSAVTGPGGFTSLSVASINASQLELEDPCDACSTELQACRDDSMCRRVILPCVMRVFTSITASGGVIDTASGLYRVPFLSSLQSQCLSTASVASWNPIQRVLWCVHKNNCNVGGSFNATQGNQTSVRFTNGSISIAVPLSEANATALVISHGQRSLRFNASIDKLPRFLESFVLQNTAEVSVEAQDYADDTSMVRLRITLGNSLLVNPSFSGTPGLVPITNVLPTGYVEFTSAESFSVDKMIQVMRAVTVDPVDAAALDHPWRLTPYCSSMNAALYGCSAEDVCLYDNATSPLAECLRDAFSRSFFTRLAQQPLQYSITVSSDITRCIQTTAALTSDSLGGNRSSLDLALARFSESGCPFGPLDLVRNDSMVILSTSTLRHTIRIRAMAFQIELEFSLGGLAIGSALLSETSNLYQQLGPVLHPIGVSINLTNAVRDGLEWTLELSYENVVASDFTVKIAPNSTPSKDAIDQAFQRPVTRFTVVPRDHSAFVDATNNGTSSTTNSSLLLTFTPRCEECDAMHLRACARSVSCRSLITRCLYERTQIIPERPDLTDFALLLRSCVDALSPSLFFDGWEPLQRWLVCYASNMCPISRSSDGRTSDSYLRFTPASITIEPSVVAYPWGDDVTVSINAPVGSSLQGRDISVNSIARLEEVLPYMTQGISSVTATHAASGTISVQYAPPFLGRLPSINANASTYFPAQLRVQSTSKTQLPTWAALVEKLQTVMLDTSGSLVLSCDACATQYLGTCRESAGCRGYLLDCVAFSLANDYQLLFDADHEFYSVLTGCSKHINLTEWLPLHQYFVCVRDLQCDVHGDASDGLATSFLRLTSGGVRLPTSSPSYIGEWSIAIADEASEMTPVRMTGTVSDLRTRLQTLLQNATRVEIVTNDASSEKSILFHDYIGKLPRIHWGEQVLNAWVPTIVAYATAPSFASTTAIETTLSTYKVLPQCTTACLNYLDACIRGDSLYSLWCRHQTLGCVAAVFNELNVDETQVDMSARFRSCALTSIKAMQPIAQYLSCFAASGCTANVPRSKEARTELQIEHGLQTITGITDTGISFQPPPGAMTTVAVTVNTTDARLLAWKLRTALLDSAADVTAVSSTESDTSRSLSIAYKNYVGVLPSVTNASVSVSETQPIVSLTSLAPLNLASSWSRLATAINSRAVDTSSACSSCVTSHLMSCPLCLSLILPSILLAVGNITSSAADKTFDLTTAFYLAVDTLAVSEWIPVANVFKCFMQNRCVASSDSVATGNVPGPTVSYLIVKPATMTLQLQDITTQTIELQYPKAPTHAITTESNAGVLSVTINRSDTKYTSLADGISSLLTKNGQSPTISVVERDVEPDNGEFILDVTIDGFYGWLPTLKSSSVTSSASHVASIYAQTYGNVTGVSIEGLVSRLSSYVSEPATVSNVPIGDCASCAAAFFACDSTEVSTGRCSYTHTTTVFVSCLRQRLPPSVFYGVAQTQNASYIIDSALSQCFGELLTSDQANGQSSITQDLWYAAHKQLACFEHHDCAFGPLTEALTPENMVKLQSQTITKTFRVMARTFEAVFHTEFGFRVLESAPFTETTSDEDVASALAAILPESQVAVTKIPLVSTDGYEISVSCHYVYVPGFVFDLRASDSVSVSTVSTSASHRAALLTVALDNTKVGAATP